MLKSSPVTADDRPVKVLNGFLAEQPTCPLAELNVHLGLAKSTFPRCPANLGTHHLLPRNLDDECWHPQDQDRFLCWGQLPASRGIESSGTRDALSTAGMTRHPANLIGKTVTEKLFYDSMFRFLELNG